MPQTIHIVSMFRRAISGSERNALGLHDILRRHATVRLWSEYPPDPVLLDRAYVRAIHAGAGVHPRGGTLVIVGCYYPAGPWLERAEPERLIVIVNTATGETRRLLYNLVARAAALGRGIELVCVSQALRRFIGLPAHVIASPIDTDRFRPAERPAGGPVVVGRLSRDVAFKHHPNDPGLYRRLAAAGLTVRVMGGTVLASQLSQAPGIQLLPAGAVQPEDFLRQLDIFAYRTAPECFEALGRVVLEAMACGLPVVVGDRGGFLDHVVDGETGFVVGSDDQAFAAVTRLAADPALRRAMGRAARRAAESLYSMDYEAAVYDYFVGNRAASG